MSAGCWADFAGAQAALCCVTIELIARVHASSGQPEYELGSKHCKLQASS
jgi:hypothetical protein